MSVSHLCLNCTPEGTPLGFGDLTSGPPTHCYGRSDTTRHGVMGGFSCSCECKRTKTKSAPKQISGKWYCTVHATLMEPGQHQCGTGKMLQILDCDPHYLVVGPSVREDGET